LDECYDSVGVSVIRGGVFGFEKGFVGWVVIVRGFETRTGYG